MHEAEPGQTNIRNTRYCYSDSHPQQAQEVVSCPECCSPDLLQAGLASCSGDRSSPQSNAGAPGKEEVDGRARQYVQEEKQIEEEEGGRAGSTGMTTTKPGLLEWLYTTLFALSLGRSA